MKIIAKQIGSGAGILPVGSRCGEMFETHRQAAWATAP